MLLLFKPTGNEGTLICCGIPVFILFVFIVTWLYAHQQAQSIFKDSKRIERKRARKIKSLQPIDEFGVGLYLAGLSNKNDDITGSSDKNLAQELMDVGVESCLVTENDFVFMSGGGKEFGRIPRDSINEIFFDDKSQISSRITATRILALGIFSLAAPKKQKDKIYCLVIDWENKEGVRQNTVFEFRGESANTNANDVANKFNEYIKPKQNRLKPDEKKCPFCAETIKNEAIICRFCNSNLDV